MSSGGRSRFTGSAALLGAVAMLAVPSSALAQNGEGGGGANGGDQVLTQSQVGAAGDALGQARGGDNNQIQQGAQQNCTIGGNGQCNQSIEQNAAINTGGGGGTVVRGRTFHRHPVRVRFVRNVPLARTGLDAWVIALLGGASAAGGLALLTAPRLLRARR